MLERAAQFEVDGIQVEVRFGRFRNVTFRVRFGKVLISAPTRLSQAQVRRLLGPRMDWVRQQLARAIPLPHSGSRQLVWGRWVELEVIDSPTSIGCVLRDDRLLLRAPQDLAARREALNAWYRDELRAQLPPYIAAAEREFQVSVPRVTVRTMSTRWGSCNPTSRRITLNSNLAKYDAKHLIATINHEVCHYFFSGHGPDFQALLTAHQPNWRGLRRELRQLPT